MQNIKITTPEELTLHLLISLVAGALLTGITAVGGVVYAHGINLPIMLTAGIGGFSTAFGAGFLAFRNNPQVQQAEVDATGQATQVASQIEQRISQQLELRFQGLLNLFQQSPLQQQPVVINNHIPAPSVPVPMELQVGPALNANTSNVVPQQQFKSTLSFPTDTSPLAALGVPPR